MSKVYRKETKKVERIVEEQVADTTCDFCKKRIRREDDENELFIYLNPGECVHQQFRKDYHTKCLLPIWDKICELIGVDPEDESPIDNG